MLLGKEAGRTATGDARRRRRVWSVDDKRRIVAETLAPGASVSVVARRHDLNANMLFTWRRAVEAALPVADDKVTFVPATITAAPARTISPPSPSPVTVGGMEIVAGSMAKIVKRPSWLECVAQEIERHVFMTSPASGILAVDDPGLLGMKLQTALGKALPDRLQDRPSLALAPAVDNCIIRISLETQMRERPLHP